MNVAILLSTTSFEDFFARRLGLTRDRYVRSWRGGWVWSYCRMLQANGLRPLIYVASRESDQLAETPEGWRVRFLRLRRDLDTVMRFPGRQRGRVLRYGMSVLNAVALRGALDRALDADDIAVLALQEYWTGRFDLLSGDLDRPFVAIDQGPLDAGAFRRVKRRTLHRADRVVVQTEVEGNCVRAHGGRAERIPNAIDHGFWCPSDEPSVERGLVVSVARLADDHKRLSDLIRAVARLGESWRLEIAGEGPDRARLERLVDELGIAHRARLSGFIGDKRALRTLLRRADVFALPSAREGLPLALLEAMSTGAAPVCTNIPAMAEVVTDGVDGLLVPVGRPDALSRAIAQAGERRAQLASAARATIEHAYTEAAVGPRLSAVLREVALGRAGIELPAGAR